MLGNIQQPYKIGVLEAQEEDTTDYKHVFVVMKKSGVSSTQTVGVVPSNGPSTNTAKMALFRSCPATRSQGRMKVSKASKPWLSWNALISCSVLLLQINLIHCNATPGTSQAEDSANLDLSANESDQGDELMDGDVSADRHALQLDSSSLDLDNDADRPDGCEPLKSTESYPITIYEQQSTIDRFVRQTQEFRWLLGEASSSYSINPIGIIKSPYVSYISGPHYALPCETDEALSSCFERVILGPYFEFISGGTLISLSLERSFESETIARLDFVQASCANIISESDKYGYITATFSKTNGRINLELIKSTAIPVVPLLRAEAMGDREVLHALFGLSLTAECNDQSIDVLFGEEMSVIYDDEPFLLVRETSNMIEFRTVQVVTVIGPLAWYVYIDLMSRSVVGIKQYEC